MPNAEDLSHLTPAAQGLYSDNEPLVTPVTYGVDDAFGRAALLGGCRRARTARCVAAGTLWALDQLPFRRVLAGHHLLGRTATRGSRGRQGGSRFFSIPWAALWRSIAAAGVVGDLVGS